MLVRSPVKSERSKEIKVDDPEPGRTVLQIRLDTREDSGRSLEQIRTTSFDSTTEVDGSKLSNLTVKIPQ